MGKTIRHQPSPDRVALVNRGGKGFHGGSKRVKARRDRQSTRRELRGNWRTA